MFDIDHFKLVNDTYGHIAGDTVLKYLGSLVRKSLRQIDIPGRLGGEEFAIILPKTNLDDALLIAERLRQSIENSPVHYKDIEINYTASFGVTGYHHQISKVDELLKIVDDALYKAKNSGRNSVVRG